MRNYLVHGNGFLQRLTVPRAKLLGLLVTALAIFALVATYAVNATANAPSAAEMQIRGWVEALENDRLTSERHAAQHNLELSGEAAVPQLVAALRSNNAVLRRNAADVLGYIASPRATEALIKTLRADPVPAVRRNAAWALGEIQDARALNELQEASVADRSPLVRATAADSLARLRTALALAADVNAQLVGAVAVAPSQSNLVYLAVKRDLLVSQDGGKSWQTLSGVLPSQISALVVHPTRPNELYAGLDGLGIYKSSDGGKTWRASNNGIEPVPGARTTISAIVIDLENPNVLFIARGVWLGTTRVEFHSLGLMMSRDAGVTWSALTTGSSEQITKLAFREGQLYGLAGDRLLTLVTSR